MKKILFVVQFPKCISPSQRFRVELYENILKENNLQFDTTYFIDDSTRRVIYRKGFYFQKTWGVMKGFMRRIAGLFTIGKYDFIFIQREASPLGPPIFEWIYAKLLRKKLIYDFDDALWIPHLPGNNEWLNRFKAFWKTSSICKWAHVVSTGNRYLYDYARQFNNNVILNPTCVDTVRQHNLVKDQHTEKITIGWTGSFSTLPYLKEILDVLLDLEKKYSFDFVVIADRNPELPLKGFRFLEWSKDTEIQDLLGLNIGVMPLTESEYTKGKCGFKLIQFLALGIPVAASAVGVNTNIVEQNENGFLCTGKEEWMKALETLLQDADLRQKMGKAGREKIQQQYSVEANKANFLSLFQ